ncbi:hypothetical protein [Empedobacter sp. UBA5987]|uniref:hypothetical protein n=1 Tax=Empedobacter sp. UBA5987 TaxID=1946444 RepID=UPI0025BE6B74|nr:hypothetical protein [Empedobacter sp. UBA5987]
MAQPILEINFKKISYDLDKVNLKYREIYYFHFLLIQKTFEIKRRSHGMAQVIQLNKLFP